MDLLDFFRLIHPWGKLIRLVRQLPRFSRYRLARADDDEIAEIEQRLGLEPPTHPPLADWDGHQELLAAMRDEFSALRSTLIAVNMVKGKPPKVKPQPRPITAAQRAERRADQATHDFIVKQVLPPRG